VDPLLLTAGIMSASLSLGTGIWETVIRSRRRIAVSEPGALEVVVSGEKAHLTKEQRQAVAQILNGTQTEPAAQH
jgi:hypothetical protein